MTIKPFLRTPRLLVLVACFSLTATAFGQTGQNAAPTLEQVRAAADEDELMRLLQQRDRHIERNWMINARPLPQTHRVAPDAPQPPTHRPADFPGVLTTRDALRHARIIGFNDGETRQWLIRFAEYQQHILDRREEISDINLRFTKFFEDTDPEEAGDFSHMYNALRTEVLEPFAHGIAEQERLLYLHASDMLAEDQRLRQMPWVELDRFRVLNDVRRLSVRATFVRGATVDLLRYFDDLDVPIDWAGEQGLFARQYLDDFVTRWRSLARTEPRVIELHRQFARMHDDADETERLEIQRRIMRPRAVQYERLARMNHEFVELLTRDLDDDLREEIDHRFRQDAYPELYPDRDRARLRDRVKELLGRDDLTDRQRSAVHGVWLEFDEWYVRHRREAERMIFDFWRPEAERLGRQDREVIFAHLRDVEEYWSQRDERVARSMRILNEIVSAR